MSVYYEVGRYEGIVTDQGLTETKTGKPCFFLQFDVTADLLPDGTKLALPPAHSFQRSIYQVITDKTIDFLMPDLERLGFSGNKLSQLVPDSPGCQLFIGDEVLLYCKHETYEGKEREQWSFAREASEVVPLDSKKAKELDALFGKKMKDHFGTAKKKPKAKSEQPATVPEDDELGYIPF